MSMWSHQNSRELIEFGFCFDGTNWHIDNLSLDRSILSTITGFGKEMLGQAANREFRILFWTLKRIIRYNIIFHLFLSVSLYKRYRKREIIMLQISYRTVVQHTLFWYERLSKHLSICISSCFENEYQGVFGTNKNIFHVCLVKCF